MGLLADLSHTFRLPKYGIGVKFVNGDDLEDFNTAIDDRMKAIFVESIRTPRYNVAPIPELAKVSRPHILNIP